MAERVSYTPEEAKAMGYDPDVVDFFKQNDPDLLEFMWENGSAHYQSILKNEIDSAILIKGALLQVRFEGRIGNVGLSSLLMAEFRLTHPQNSASQEEGKPDHT
jgi:translation initiation factor 2 beta subunit (eIF-2beta)/eIF-5